MTAPKLTIVAAAVIRRDGRILVCRRRAGQDHAGKWEFPGGKLEPGETATVSLRRELQEELLIEAKIGREILSYEYAYPGRKPIRLIFFEVTEYSGSPNYSHFQEACWAAPEDLPGFDFLAGDVAFVKQLAAGEFEQSGAA
jgi:8-oxo-dGTP diphosphatase